MLRIEISIGGLSNPIIPVNHEFLESKKVTYRDSRKNVIVKLCCHNSQTSNFFREKFEKSSVCIRLVGVEKEG